MEGGGHRDKFETKPHTCARREGGSTVLVAGELSEWTSGQQRTTVEVISSTFGHWLIHLLKQCVSLLLLSIPADDEHTHQRKCKIKAPVLSIQRTET